MVKHYFRKVTSWVRFPPSAHMISASKNDLGFKVSSRLWRKIVKYYEEEYSGVIPSSFAMEEFAWHRLKSAREQLFKMKLVIGDFNKRRICLDAGCGLGQFVVLARLSGYKFYGYDTDEKALSIAKEILQLNGLSPGIIKGSVEDFLSGKMKFGLVTSFQVVEHVRKINSYLSFLRKVMSKKSVLFIETPNYRVPYEPHFYVFLPPGPRIIRWLFCRLAGRTNHRFFNELNFVTSTSLESILRKNKFRVDNLGQKAWLDELLQNPSAQRSRYVHWVSSVIRHFRLKLLVEKTANWGLYTPLRYLCYPK